jgi:hypothetical protein
MESIWKGKWGVARDDLSEAIVVLSDKDATAEEVEKGQETSIGNLRTLALLLQVSRLLVLHHTFTAPGCANTGGRGEGVRGYHPFPPSRPPS